MSTAPEIKQGVYQHYKGGKYLVLFVADVATNGQEGKKEVVYVSLTNGMILCRNLDEFTEVVKWPDGGMKPRFIGAYSSFKKRPRK